MRWLNALLLLVIASCLAAANLWYAAARSTIPLALADSATAVEVRREKHPGRDDVYLLRTKSGNTLHVDEEVAKAISVPADLQKAAWSSQLSSAGISIPLVWSRDCRGMAFVMPGALLVVVATVGCVVWQVRCD